MFGVVGCENDSSTNHASQKVESTSQTVSDTEDVGKDTTTDAAVEETAVATAGDDVYEEVVEGLREDIPVYGGYACIEVNSNEPMFTDQEKTSVEPFEEYSELDDLGRCQVAYANICKELQPTEKRGEIGSVRPSGWQTVKYNNLIEGNYLYNRCHLIGYQLAGENANEKNLITGTRYLNVVGMLPFENAVDDYLEENAENHVLYRVTPIFSGDELVARGVLMEAYSVEDDGDSIRFCQYCYDVQPGIQIDYSTGKSNEDSSVVGIDKPASTVLPTSKPTNKTTKKPTKNPVKEDKTKERQVWLSEAGSKYHSINDCGRMNPDKATQVSESDAIDMGMEKCSRCW